MTMLTPILWLLAMVTPLPQAAAVPPAIDHAAPALAARGLEVGVVAISDDSRVDVMARGLSEALGDPVDRMARRLRAARATPGPGVYLQLQHEGGPSEVEVIPTTRSSVYFPVGQRPMAGIIPAGVNPRGTLVMLWVLKGEEKTYRLFVPASFRHLTIVANGREVVVRQPFDAAKGRRTYPIR